MKRPWALAAVALNLAALVGLVFVYPHLMISPGALGSGHATLATDCFACHAPLRGAAAARCTACHAPADIGLRTTTGVALPHTGLKRSFHQELVEGDCMACHSDHQGPRLTQHSRKPFSHALLKPATRDRCADCHVAPANALHRQVKQNCQQCHSQARWTPATFKHDKLFRLDGDHAAPCETCHVSSDFSRYTCYGCHEHTPARIRQEHAEEGIGDFEDCARCHRSAAGEGEGRGGGERD